MKVAILGAGALGSVIGGLMAEQGIDVCLLDVNAAHIQAINETGLRLDTPEGTRQIAIPAMRPEQCPQDVDLIILLTKIYHSDAALEAIRPVIDAGALVLTIQNGLGNAERVARHVPKSQVLIGATMIPGGFKGPGHVESQAQSWTVFRPLDQTLVPMAERVAATLAPVGFSYSEDTDREIWQKAAFNCAMNATCALVGGPVGALSANENGRALAHATADEVVDVAQAQDIAVERDAVHQHINVALAEHQGHKPSMLQDIEAGRRTEIEALCREVARQADATGTAAPLNKTLATLIELKSGNSAA